MNLWCSLAKNIFSQGPFSNKVLKIKRVVGIMLHFSVELTKLIWVMFIFILLNKKWLPKQDGILYGKQDLLVNTIELSVMGELALDFGYFILSA